MLTLSIKVWQLTCAAGMNDASNREACEEDFNKIQVIKFMIFVDNHIFRQIELVAY